MTLTSKGSDRFYRIAYAAVLVCFAAYLFIFTDLYGAWLPKRSIDFSESWRTDGGEAVDVDLISTAMYGGSVALEKTLPGEFVHGNTLCFSSKNAKLAIFLDGKLIYAYDTTENLTGAGYGLAHHTIALSLDDVGKTLRIELESVFPDGSDGRLYGPFLCSATDYVHMLFRERHLSFATSMLVLFFGVLSIVVGLWVSRNVSLPFSLMALGVDAILLGGWCLVDTGLPQLMTDGVISYRVMNYLLLHLAEYPSVRFVNSITRQKRPIYPRIMFWLSMFFIALMLFLRYGMGMDMHMLTPIAYLSYFSMLVLTAVIIVDNTLYCKRQDLAENLDFFHIGAACFFTGGVLDALVYLLDPFLFPTHGTFLRVGLCAFIFEMMLQFLRWWSGEHASNERERFINKILQFTMSANDPEESIHAMLSYLGAMLHAERAYIFEDMGSGIFDNTYEWCSRGVTPEIDNLKGLPYEGVVETWYNEYRKSHYVLIRDLEAYRAVNEDMYAILAPQGIHSLVTGPLEVNGKYIGFFGVDNPPADKMDEIAEIVRLLSYFLAQLVLQRDEQKRLIRYSYYDALTGCKNRRALEEYESTQLNPSAPYGFVMCDINGLKAMNDTAGHEAGDALITDVADSLIAAFGAENVYRTGGDEFAVYICGGSAERFEAGVAQLRSTLAEKGRSAAIGAVFRAQGDPNFERAKADADALMYADKEAYYLGRNDRRKR